MLHIRNHALGGYRLIRNLAAPISLLRAIKLLYVLLVLPHSLDDRIKSRHKLVLRVVESGDAIL